MRYLATILLAGCCTVPEPVIKVVDNPEKDKYIAKLESEASDGASALSVATKNIEGKGKTLVELTQVRLAGIKEPSVAKVDEYLKALTSPKLLEEERKKAAKVQDEADRLQMEANRLDEENRDLRDTLEAAQKDLSLIHISEPTRLRCISYAVFCLKKIFLMIRRPPRSTLD